MSTSRLHVDKIASATKNIPLQQDVLVSSEIIAKEGYVVTGRIRGEKSVYNELENPQGRMMPLHDGDVIVGVLGHRSALHGYSGVVPSTIDIGQMLNVLNLGGVIGQVTSANPDIGEPFGFEVIGSVLALREIDTRSGEPAHAGMNAIHAGQHDPKPPVVFVAGTSMNSGKTLAACQLIRALSAHGTAVGACKLTGVSLLRDTLQMRDYGARWAVSFMDAGVVSTSPETAVHTARTVISHLGSVGAEVIVAELGDGLLGQYGVAQILADRELASRGTAFVLCANDPVGAWGGVSLLHDRYGIAVDVVSGPTTDNEAGTAYIEAELRAAAINARSHAAELGKHVADLLGRVPA